MSVKSTDVGEIDLLDGALRNAGASKDTKVGSELLFQIEPKPALGAETADIGCRRRRAGGFAE